jgi:hypothetical protein
MLMESHPHNVPHILELANIVKSLISQMDSHHARNARKVSSSLKDFN